MKIIKFLIIPAFFIGNFSFAEDDLTIETNRDILEKIPLVLMQPMLDHCKKTQPLLTAELEATYSIAKVKMINAVKNIQLDGINPLQYNDIDQPINENFKKELNTILAIMTTRLQDMDSQQYCRTLIHNMNVLDEEKFQQIVESQYRNYIEKSK